MTLMPRKIFTFDDDLIRDIDDFRFENRIKSEAEAVRRLLVAGLKAERQRSKGDEESKKAS